MVNLLRPSMRMRTLREEPRSPGDLLELSHLPLDSHFGHPEGSVLGVPTTLSPAYALTKTTSPCHSSTELPTGDWETGWAGIALDISWLKK